MSAKVRRIGDQWAILCPGCGVDHRFDGRWTFNGDREFPTITPGLRTASLVRFTAPNEEGQTSIQVRCEAVITEGVISFKDISTHALKGQTVDLPDFPEPAPEVPGTTGG